MWGNILTRIGMYHTNDNTVIVDEMVHIHLLCSLGLRLIMAFGKKRYGAIYNALKFTSVMPAHKSIGKKIIMQSKGKTKSMSL
jgi:hypothetical protein